MGVSSCFPPVGSGNVRTVERFLLSVSMAEVVRHGIRQQNDQDLSARDRADRASYPEAGGPARGEDQAWRDGFEVQENTESGTPVRAAIANKESRPSFARLDLRGQYRPHESRRAVRSEKRRQGQHLRGLVDQAVDPTRPREPEQDDPPARTSGGQNLPDAQDRTPAHRKAGARADRGRTRHRTRCLTGHGAAVAGGFAAPDLAGLAHRRGWRCQLWRYYRRR